MSDDAANDRKQRLRQARRLTREAFAALERGTMPVSRATRSMVPLLRGGELLHWRRAHQKPALGALVIFHRKADARLDGADDDADLGRLLTEQDLTVHRVIGFDAAGRVRTKGDGVARPDFYVVQAEQLLGVVFAIERAQRVFSLEGRAARWYARLVAGLSVAGGTLFRLAEAIDAGLRRVFSPFGKRWWARKPAWWCQRLAQELVHSALFRACHRRIALDRTQRPESAGETRA
ncbi:MAG: S24/S26 family peptidase [Acidobacteriota bacterium]|nr:MAG: S24/S26 family peptidase [Acidobacteriota bacterium]